MDAEQLSITLPTDMARMIRQPVENGAYASNSEVIREAVRLWQDRRAEHERRPDMLRVKIQEAIDDPDFVTDEELGRHFDQRLADAEKQRRS